MGKLDPHKAEIDIILAINKFKRFNDNVNRNYIWVPSHQDEEAFHSIEMRTNERADELATETRDNVIEGIQLAHPKQFFDGARAMLKIKGSFITKDLKKSIHKALFEPDIDEYLYERYKWAKEIFANIDWQSLESALTGAQGMVKTMIIKLMHRWQPTNLLVQRNERRPLSEGKCMGCGESDEQWHYLHCQSPPFCEARSQAWIKFCQHMKKYKQHESLLRIIWIGIQNWVFKDFDETLPKGSDINDEEYTKLCKAYEAQQSIGWQHFLVGRVSKTWAEYYAMTLPEDKTKQGKIIAFGKRMVEAVWTFHLICGKFIIVSFTAQDRAIQKKCTGNSRLHKGTVRNQTDVHNHRRRVVVWRKRKNKIRKNDPTVIGMD